MSEYLQYFGALEQQYGLPPGYLARTAQIESGMNPSAQNPRSSAGGMFQFIDSTASQYGLDNRMDWRQSADAAARLASDNQQSLMRRLGRPLTAAELYMAHQQGAGGAYGLLSNPNARASDIVGGAAVGLNGGRGSGSAAEFSDHILNYYGQDGSQGSQPSSAPRAPQTDLPGMPRPQNALAAPQQRAPWRPTINMLDAAAFQTEPQNVLAQFYPQAFR